VACAFGFGVHHSDDRDGDTPQPFPPGIPTAVLAANLRCKWFSLPYGDQALSVPSSVFRHLGGFPDQSLMEDYEFVALLRARTQWSGEVMAALAHAGVHAGMKAAPPEEERGIAILPGRPALCSVRRWTKFGVPNVTLINSTLVTLYASGRLTPDKLYRKYYSRACPAREVTESPWEIELAQALTP